MIIVLEGPDGAGKSTLAHQLVELHEVANGPGTAVIWHEGPPPEGGDLVTHYELPLLLNRDQITSSTDLVILDRWETGELIYGPLLRGRSRLSPGQALHVDLLLRSLGAIRVLVNPGLFWLDKRHDEKPDELIKKEWLPGLVDFYEAYAGRHRWITVQGADSPMIETILHNAILQMLDVAHVTTFFPGYVGPPRPDVLLVGEHRGNWPVRPDLHTSAWGWGAFTPTGDGNSSRWLLDSLERLPVLPAVGLCNAEEHGQDLWALWVELGMPAVVALGRTASATLAKTGIYHEMVNHPQWAKRFRNKHPEEYDQSLREGIQNALRDREERGPGVRPAPGPGGEPRPARQSEDAAG